MTSRMIRWNTFALLTLAFGSDAATAQGAAERKRGQHKRVPSDHARSHVISLPKNNGWSVPRRRAAAGDEAWYQNCGMARRRVTTGQSSRPRRVARAYFGNER